MDSFQTGQVYGKEILNPEDVLTDNAVLVVALNRQAEMITQLERFQKNYIDDYYVLFWQRDTGSIVEKKNIVWEGAMKIATVLFTYNRPVHTQKVLESLARNEKKPEKLIIFQDGMKAETNKQDWKAVSEEICAVDWCNTQIHISETNYGLACSISSGISQVFRAYDAVIVLEDDCVAHPMFMDYMYEGLKKYQDEKQVYGIGGCPVILMDKESGDDAYFVQRISSHGWGTWKDRWEQYERDYSILKRIKGDPKACERLRVWGNDLEAQLLGNVTGQCNSWAVFWALKVIEQNGLFLSPYDSLITNIGFDGSGVHCGTAHWDVRCRVDSDMDRLTLPEKLYISDSARQSCIEQFYRTPSPERNKSYREMLCRWIRLKQQEKKIVFPYGEQKVAFWGKGWLFDLLQAEFGGQMQVQCIVETHPDCKEYRGIPVCMVNEIPREIDTVVIIPFCDIDVIRRKIWKNRPDITKIIGVDEIIR